MSCGKTEQFKVSEVAIRPTMMIQAPTTTAAATAFTQNTAQTTPQPPVQTVMNEPRTAVLKIPEPATVDPFRDEEAPAGWDHSGNRFYGFISTSDHGSGVLTAYWHNGSEIYGNVFADKNQNGIQDDPATEPGVSAIHVFLDTNGDGIRNSDETRTDVTDSTGAYRLERVMPHQSGVVRVYSLNKPYVPRPRTDEVVGLAGQDVAGGDIGLYPISEITGLVYEDLDGDGKRGQGEPPLGDVLVYLDANGNGVFDSQDDFAKGKTFSRTYHLRDLDPRDPEDLALAGTYDIYVGGGLMLAQQPVNTFATQGKNG